MLTIGRKIPNEDTLVAFSHVTKEFGSLKALDDVSLEIKKGQIHGLLGENGAGKTCLMKILYGLYQPTSGDISFKGQPVKIKKPQDAIDNGIAMVHQISSLVSEFTAVENIIMGTYGEKFVLPIDRERSKIKELSESLGFSFPLDTKIKELSAGVKQKIEIVRSLYRGAALLILDEPTTALVEKEFEQLLVTLRSLVKSGVTVVFITHKMREVMAACDCVTVLRKGRIQGNLDIGEMSKEKLVKLMFTEKDIDITDSALPEVNLPEAMLTSRPVLKFKKISSLGSDENAGLKEVSFEVYGGEIFGVASIAGNGEHEIASCIIDPQHFTQGDILFEGQSIRNFSTRDVLEYGVGYTPEDRTADGMLTGGSIRDNIILGHQREPLFCKLKTFMNWASAAKVARSAINEYTIAAANEMMDIARLSGGNAQRVILARALLNQVKLLVTHNPTMGLDISSVEFIFDKLINIRSKGGAVLWINADLDELLIVSDRIGVFYNGELKEIFTRSQFDKYKIGAKMIGG